MKCYFILFLLYTGLLIASCTKSTQNHADQSLSGKWKWIHETNASAINGPPYDTLTPQNTGITEFLNLNGDGTWLLLKNNKIANGGNYKIVQVTSPGGPIDLLDLVNKTGKDSLVNHSISNDTLYMSNSLYTGSYTVDVYAR